MPTLNSYSLYRNTVAYDITFLFTCFCASMFLFTLVMLLFVLLTEHGYHEHKHEDDEKATDADTIVKQQETAL